MLEDMDTAIEKIAILLNVINSKGQKNTIALSVKRSIVLQLFQGSDKNIRDQLQLAYDVSHIPN